MKADMDRKTARKYVAAGKLPSELKQPRDWQTRPDPFEAHWPEIEARLRETPEFEAKTLFDLQQQQQHPGRGARTAAGRRHADHRRRGQGADRAGGGDRGSHARDWEHKQDVGTVRTAPAAGTDPATAPPETPAHATSAGARRRGK